MKFNLKNRPKKRGDTELPNVAYEKWFVGFEAELRVEYENMSNLDISDPHSAVLILEKFREIMDE